MGLGRGGIESREGKRQRGGLGFRGWGLGVGVCGVGLWMEHWWRGQGKRTSVEASVVVVRLKSLGESKEQGEQAEAANGRVLDNGSSHCSAWVFARKAGVNPKR